MRGRRYACWIMCLGLLMTPGILWAEQAHGDCAMCHGNRLGVGLAVFNKQRKIPIINPSTGKPLERIESICLSCHGDEEFKAQLKESGVGISFLDDTEAKPEGTSTPLDEMELGPVDVGFKIIDLHETHPVGIVTKKVILPEESRGFKWQENQLTCLGCHDHHPSNPNYKYLRWPTDGGEDINGFCAHCHADKVQPESVEPQRRHNRGMLSTSE